MKLSLVQPKSSNKPYLYWVVFDTVLVKSMITFLFVFFLFSPAEAAFAADEEAADAPVEEAVVAEEPEPEPEPEVVQLEEDLAEATETESEPSTQPEGDDSAEAGESQVIATEPADADELVVSEEESESTETTTETSSDDTEAGDSQTETGNTDTEESTEGDTEVAPADGDEAADDDSATSTVSETQAEDNASAGSRSGVTEEVTGATTTESVVVATSTATSTDTYEPNGEEETELTSTTTDMTTEVTTEEPEAESEVEVATEEAGEEVATSTDTQIVYVYEQSTTDLNRHTFAEDECVSVGDGSYYCSQSSITATAHEDGVYAERDESEGDHEIFFREGGSVTQLTDNSYEDRSPYFDPETETVVFHRLVEGRYQIFSVATDGNYEVQLTSDHTNHMEPVRSGDVTGWQEWVNDNWEIGAVIDGERALLTNNSRHDVAPTIKDGYIMWHVTNSDGDKLLSVYEIETGITSDIADPDGGQVENPRFVLVYDTKFENGDLVTKTFDPETGEVRPVGSQPAPPPALPDPEPTGEESAIIQNKSSNKSETEEAVDDLINAFKAGTASSSPTSDGDTGSTATGTSEMVGEDVGLGVDVDMSEEATSTLPLTEFDLIVEPYEATSSAQSTDSASSSDSVE